MDWTWQKLWAVKSSFIDWWLCGTTFISIKETEGPGLKLAAARRKMMSVWRERAELRAVTEGLMLDYLVLQQKQKCSCQQNMPDSWHNTQSLPLHLLPSSSSWDHSSASPLTFVHIVHWYISNLPKLFKRACEMKHWSSRRESVQTEWNA